MGFRKSAGAFSLGLSLVAAALTTGTQAAAQAPGSATPPPAHAKAVHPARSPAATATPTGFTIERPPAWVQPLAVDAATPIAAAPYQILVADEQIRAQPTGDVDFRHYIRQINDASGLQQGGQIELEFDPGYQKLIFHKVDILRGTQRIDKLDAKNVKLLHREQQLERQMVDGRMTASLVLDDLRVGDRVEWEASVVGANPVFGGKFVDSEWTEYPNGPTGLWQLRLLVPAEREIHTRVGDPAIETSTSVHDGLRETLFKRSNLPQLQGDDHLPPAEYMKFQIDLSEFADWHDVASWSAQLFAHATRPTPALDAQVAALKAKAGSDAREALLRTTLDFVQKDIRYFGTENGIGSHQPADVDTVLRQRFGDCKDKVALLAALLTRMGFDAQPTLVSAHYQSATAQRLPSPFAFDHAIVRVMVDGKPVWLDGTRSQQTGAIATRESVGLGFGLVAQEGVTALTELPNGRDRIHIETADTFSFPKLAQEGTLTSVVTLHGDAAEWFRTGLASQPRAQIDKFVSAEALRVYPSLTPTAPAEFDVVTEDDSVKITTHYRTGDFWTLAEQRLLVARYSLYGLFAPLRFPDQPTRTQPFRIASPGRFLHTVKFVYGEPFPGNPNNTHFDETNNNFAVHVQVDMVSPTMEISGELRQFTDVIAPADWQAYRDKLNKVGPHLAAGLTVSPFSVEQSEAFRVEGERLMEKFRKGEIKTATQAESGAQMRLLAFDKELDSDRLPPKLRAQVLTAKGIQLDMLGQPHAAEGPLKAAIVLDAASAEAHEALAANAVFRREDAEALREADETLRLSPSNVQPHFLRGYTHFFSGDMAAASGDFRDVLQSRAEVEKGYGALWLYLSTRRAGGDGVQAIKPFEPTGSHPEWPFAVLQLMEGKIDMDAALAASHENGQRSASRECELYFYAGEKAVADGDLAKARTYLGKSVATGVTEFTEYPMSQRELARLGAR